jgi:hypothetical protein
VNFMRVGGQDTRPTFLAALAGYALKTSQAP